MSMTVPDFMPTLSKGAHGPGDGKACVMEYVSVLAGERWSDHPSCTHSMIASIARAVNDNVYDKQRHLLIPLIPRLLVANTRDTDIENKVLVDKMKKWLLAYKSEWLRGGVMEAATKHFHTIACKCCIPSIVNLSIDSLVVAVLAESNDVQQVKFLTDALDEFDRVIGRTTPVLPVEEDKMTVAVCTVEGRPLPKPPVMQRSGWKQVAVATMDKATYQWINATQAVVPVLYTEEKVWVSDNTKIDSLIGSK